MERGLGIRRDVRKLSAEASEFPTLCETCLGPNPLIRMLREKSGKECKICERPFTMFRWKPGPKARYKQTIICQNCSKAKNLCQTCLFDLEYGLPVQVRDQFIKGGIELSDSNINLNYQLNKLENGQLEMPAHSAPNEMLSKLARTAPYYRRNKPRVCTFWLRNLCNRGEECPYLHEDVGHIPTPSDKNIRDRFKGENDPLALKILKGLEKEQEKKEEEQLPDGVYPSMLPKEAEKRM